MSKFTQFFNISKNILNILNILSLIWISDLLSLEGDAVGVSGQNVSDDSINLTCMMLWVESTSSLSVEILCIDSRSRSHDSMLQIQFMVLWFWRQKIWVSFVLIPHRVVNGRYYTFKIVFALLQLLNSIFCTSIFKFFSEFMVNVKFILNCCYCYHYFRFQYYHNYN